MLSDSSEQPIEASDAGTATSTGQSLGVVPRSEFKGQLFLGGLTALGARHGAGALRRVLDGCEGPVGDALRSSKLQSSGWYPAAWVSELYRAVHRVVDGGLSVERELGREAVLADRRGIFRPVLHFASPERILPIAPLVYGLYVRGPKQAVLERGPGVARVRWSGCRGFDASIRELHVGATLGLIDIAGGEGVEVEQIPGRPDDELELRATWR
jgi:hypothetical protein